MPKQVAEHAVFVESQRKVVTQKVDQSDIQPRQFHTFVVLSESIVSLRENRKTNLKR